MTIAHGTILGGLSTVPDIDVAIAAYRDTLGLDFVERAILPEGLARSWGVLCQCRVEHRHTAPVQRGAVLDAAGRTAGPS